MSVVVSFRVPKKLKEKMDKLRRYIDWSEELRRFVEKRIMEFERDQTINEIEELIRSIPRSLRGSTVKYAREDRDSY